MFNTNCKWTHAQRIRARADFLLCYEVNCRIFSKYFVLFTHKKEQDCWRAGFTVSKKMGNAVRRNSIKRVLREFFRLHGQSIPAGIDIVVVPKKSLLGVPISYDLVYNELYPLLKKLARLHDVSEVKDDSRGGGL